MVRPHAGILELETQHRGDVEANLVTITLKFSGETLALDTESNVAFGPAKQPQLVGKAD